MTPGRRSYSARAKPAHFRVADWKLIQKHRVLFVLEAEKKRRIVVQHKPADDFVTAVVQTLRLTTQPCCSEVRLGQVNSHIRVQEAIPVAKCAVCAVLLKAVRQTPHRVRERPEDFPRAHRQLAA